ncbi:unnamed protein product, partial [marine sediment metagenome]
ILAYDDDRKTLSENNIGNIDVENTLLNSILFYQFFQRDLKYFYKRINKNNKTSSINELTFLEFPKKLKPDDSIYLFFVLSELKNGMNLFNINNNYISRGKLLTSIFGLCNWIENNLRKKYGDKEKKQNLFLLLTEAYKKKLNMCANFSMPVKGEDTRSETLEELYRKININFKHEKNIDIANGRLITLIRNYVGHNYSTNNHILFLDIEKYVSKILNVIFKIFG